MTAHPDTSFAWTQPESLSEQLRQWTQTAPAWEPAFFCRDRSEVFLRRTSALRKRLAMPLVVAMLGGTGTGKSTLLNALVGENVVKEGRERPTTAEPTLVCHEDINPTAWSADLAGFRMEQRSAQVLERMVLLDCPDPDTTEDEDERETNLARLRRILPLCDILLVTSTQQKYRSRRVMDELAAAAPGARLVFVQTHADKEVDIREDWAKLLENDYETGRIFLVDSVAAMKAQQEKTPLPSEFSELLTLLSRELNEEAALAVRQKNFFSLANQTLDECHAELEDRWHDVHVFRGRISEERRRFGDRLSETLRDELIRDRRLWESRLLGRVASQWGYSPFSLLLRLYQGLGGLVSGVLLARGFTSPSRLALWGTYEGFRSIRKWADSKKLQKYDKGSGKNAAVSGRDEGRIRESALILAGFAADARIRNAVCEPELVLAESRRASEAFVADITEEFEVICDRLTRRNSRWWTRVFYESLFGVMLLFLLLRPAKNFFIDTVFDPNAAMFGIGFYFQSLFWLIAWGTLLLGLFSLKLRRGLEREINETSALWGHLPALNRIFEAAETEGNRVMAFRDELDVLRQRIERVNRMAEKLDKRLGRKKKHNGS